MLDVRDPVAIAAFAKAAGKVDVLFNCAGSVPKGTVLDIERRLGARPSISTSIPCST